MAEERLQKILAQAGIASRRKAEELIEAGRVRVDGRIVTELGSKADPRAKIEVDGRRIQREQLCYGVLHKPRHMVTTLSDPEGRPMAKDLLDQVGVRVVPIGRLDFNTSGALLFTNDGDFAQGLSHASGNVPKVYVAKLQGRPTDQQVERWRESIDVEGKRTRPADVRILRQEDDKCWIEVTISEGRNRQVRRLGEHANTPVVRLSRLSHAGITTEGLRPGEWRLLTVDELKELKKKYGVPKKIRGVMEEDDERRPVRAQRPQRFNAEAARNSTRRPARTSERSEGRGPTERAAEKRGASGGRGAADSTPNERGARPFERSREKSPATRGLWSDFDDVASDETKRGRGVRAVGAERASARGGEGRGASGPSRGPSARSSSGPSRGPSARSGSGPSRGPSARSSSGPSRGPSARSGARGPSERGSFERGASARGASGPSRGPSERSGARGPSERGSFERGAPRGRGAAGESRGAGRSDGERSPARSSESRGRPAEARGRSTGRPGASGDRPVTRGRPSTRGGAGGAGGARAEGPTRGRAEPSNRGRSQGVKPESRGSKSAPRPKKRS